MFVTNDETWVFPVFSSQAWFLPVFLILLNFGLNLKMAFYGMRLFAGWCLPLFLILLNIGLNLKMLAQIRVRRYLKRPFYCEGNHGFATDKSTF